MGSPPEETLEHAYAWSTSGNVVKLALTCGKGEHSPEAGYQATPNALAIFLHEAKNLYRFTLSRQ